MAYSKLKIAEDGAVTIITLSDPATMNAASTEMAQELQQALREAAAPVGKARAIVITGDGRGFCSGANLQPGGTGSRPAGGDGRPDAGDALETIYNPLVTCMKELSVPIVTAVNGAAAGVGCSLAMLGDIIVAAEGAYFLQAFRRIGLIPDGGSTYMLPRAIGKARAMEMALLGERLAAPKALEWGLINRVVPAQELMPTALALAHELASGPASLGLTRQTIWAGLDSDWAEQLNRERIGQREAGRTDDFREGVSAFLQKRPAAFTGR
ncbi:MAG TPA: enoyl-CoA hydratase/isomerase [Caulobacteraceae bacterium]|jgi:2-(1,2-epoxy-1,2-dihydrophenyl)acetyl-CoA isomerase